jgi:hypothetical protein
MTIVGSGRGPDRFSPQSGPRRITIAAVGEAQAHAQSGRQHCQIYFRDPISYILAKSSHVVVLVWRRRTLRRRRFDVSTPQQADRRLLHDVSIIVSLHKCSCLRSGRGSRRQTTADMLFTFVTSGIFLFGLVYFIAQRSPRIHRNGERLK